MDLSMCYLLFIEYISLHYYHIDDQNQAYLYNIYAI